MLKVVILGAGNIAQSLDSVEGDSILTHVKGFKRNPNFSVIGIYDIDSQKSKDAMKKWDIPLALNNPEEILNLKPDVVSICTPDQTHIEYLKLCLQAEPKLVFCEKPIGLNFEESKKIVDEYNERKIYLAVNYSRRWIPEIIRYTDPKMVKGYGKALSCRIRYVKGFLHNASHFIDLLNSFVSSKLLDGVRISEIFDYSEDDPSISASCMLSSSGGVFPLYIEGYDSRKMLILEFEIIFEKIRIFFEHKNGAWITSYELQQDNKNPVLFEFTKELRNKIDYSNAMKNAIVNIYNTLCGNELLFSTGYTALESLKLCKQILSLDKRIMS
jgi:predicted dehydrogenase